MYVVEGDPGAGKTILALQFLMEGARLAEPCLYVTLSETAHELQEVAASHGWAIDGIELRELDTLTERLPRGCQLHGLSPADMELGETVKHIRAEVERLKPRSGGSCGCGAFSGPPNSHLTSELAADQIGRVKTPLQREKTSLI